MSRVIRACLGATATVLWASINAWAVVPPEPVIDCDPANYSTDDDPQPGTTVITGAIIIGTEDGDKLNGTDEDDLIVGLGGNDKISGHEGNDIMCGGEGAVATTTCSGVKTATTAWSAVRTTTTSRAALATTT